MLTSFAIENDLHTTLPITPDKPNLSVAEIHALMDAAATERGFDLPHYTEKPGKYNFILQRVIHVRTYRKEGRWLRVSVANIVHS